jgi:hypothetical protein
MATRRLAGCMPGYCTGVSFDLEPAGSILGDPPVMPDPTEVLSSVRHAVTRLRAQLASIRNELPAPADDTAR